MSCPSKLRFFQEGVDARESSTGQDLCIRDFVLPFYPEVCGVEVVEFSCMALVDCAGF